MRTIIWSDYASKRLKKIHKFHKRKAGAEVANRITKNVYKSTDRLKEYPISGQIEENVISLNLEYRYIVSGHTKVIYRLLSSDGILITDAFDTRQDPIKMRGSATNFN